MARRFLAYCAGSSVTADFHTSLVRLVARDPSVIVSCLRIGPALHLGRSYLLDAFARSPADVCVMLDTDMSFSPEDVDVIVDGLSRGVGVVSGVYLGATGIPDVGGLADARPLAYRFTDGSYVQLDEVPAEPVDVDGVGAGFMAISREVLDHVWAPGAFHHVNLTSSHQLGEDLSFSRRVRDAGLRIVLDPRARPRHVKPVLV